MKFSYILEAFPRLIEMLPMTISLFITSAFLGLLISIFLTVCALSKIKIVRTITNIFVSFMRSNPGLIHILIIYFGIPFLFKLIGFDLNFLGKFGFSVIALSLYHAGSITEIFRAGYQTIDIEQHAAAASIGMTKFQKNSRIIIPQLVPIVLPMYTNALIDLFGDTSLLFTIGLVDMMSMGNILISRRYGMNKLEVYVVIALIYWAVILLMNSGIKLIEKKMGNHLQI